MDGRLDEISPRLIKDHKIAAIFDDGARPELKWSLRSALVGAVTHGNGQYAINEGEWYRLDQNFTDAIERTFRELLVEWDVAPPPLRKEFDEAGNGKFQTEESYNAELAARWGLVLLDRRLITVPRIDRSGFELCDLLDIDQKRFIHVKKSSRRSSVLSHFFKQGSNAAQQFRRFPEVEMTLQNLVRQISGDAARQRLIDAIADRDRKWTVEFVIADSPRANGQFDIPVFSKISLRDEVNRLLAMNYLVNVKFVGLEPENL